MKNKKVLSLRTKIEAVAVGLLLIGITIGSVWAARTITDTKDTWTGTLMLSGNTDFVSGIYFNLSKKIVCSNGLVYNATATGLQAAIYSLNNATGWVDGANVNISISASIKVTNNLELRNCNLFLANSANKSMIINYDTTNGNRNIYIHDCKLNGNGNNQPTWWRSTAGIYQFIHTILLRRCNNVLLENLNITNSQSTGIWCGYCSNVTTTNCRIFNTAVAYETQTYQHWFSAGIMYDGTNMSTISDCIVDRSFNSGIKIEAIYNVAPACYVHDVTVSNCVVRRTEVGYYTEASKRITISNCVATNISYYKVYHYSVGFSLAATSYDSIISNCVASHIGTSNGTYGGGFLIQGKNNTVTDCTSVFVKRYCLNGFGRGHVINNFIGHDSLYQGINVEMYNASIIGGLIYNCADRGIVWNDYASINNHKGIIMGVQIYNVADAIRIVSRNISVIGNSIDVSTGYGIEINAMNCIVNGNHISRTTNDAIRINNGNCSIANNVIFTASDGIDLRAKNNTVIGNLVRGCTNGIYEGTGADRNIIIGNNCQWGCTTPIDINGGNSTWFYANAWRYGYNYGAIS